MRWLVAVVVAVCAVGPARAWAQATASPGPFVFSADERVSLHPDASYVFGDTDGGLVFEAQVAPDLLIVSNIAAQLARVHDTPERVRRAYAVYATPMFRLRMFRESSNPVRTPSYMPKVSAQYVWFKKIGDGTDDEPSRGPIRAWALDAVLFGHHSNGQNGCLFLDQARGSDDECAPEETDGAASRPVNTKDGSFSTNYLRAIVGYRRMYLRGDNSGEPARVTRTEWGVRVGYEAHPGWYGPGKISEALRVRYGANRVLAGFDAAFRDRAPVPWLDLARIEVRVTAMYIHDGPPDMPMVYSGEAFVLPRTWGGTGLFARYYYGQDYYNVAFTRKINRLQFGVTWGQSKFLPFRVPSTG